MTNQLQNQLIIRLIDAISDRLTKENEFIDILKSLKSEKGFDINYVSSSGYTALSYACVRPLAEENDLKKIQILLQNGSNPNKKDSSKATPILLAINAGNIKAVELLLKNGADPNLRGNNNATIHHYGALSRNQESIDYLLSIKTLDVTINDVDLYELTPLQYTLTKIKSGKTQVMEWLIDNGANVDKKDSKGKTLLYQAIELEDIDTISLLLSRGANFDTSNAQGKGPLDLLCKNQKFAKKLISNLEQQKNEKDSNSYKFLQKLDKKLKELYRDPSINEENKNEDLLLEKKSFITRITTQRENQELVQNLGI